MDYKHAKIITNFFDIEKARNELATLQKDSLFLATYSSNELTIHNKNTTKFWDSLYLNQETNGGHIERERIQTIIKWLKPINGNMLNIGFGRGKIEKLLIDSGQQIKLHGIEISTESIKMTDKINGRFTKGTADDIEYPNNYFDVVLAMEVLEHIPTSKTMRVYREIYRVLKPNGSFIISIPINEELETLLAQGRNPNGHVRNYTKSILDAELRLNNFDFCKSKELTAYKNYYFIKYILSHIFINRWKPNNYLVMSRIKKKS